MLFFCYHRDRPGSTDLRWQLREAHWSSMDGFDAATVARGPTYDGEVLTGSVHVLELADPAAARAFASDELGTAVLLTEASADGARRVLSADRYPAVEVHRWRPGGRPA